MEQLIDLKRLRFEQNLSQSKLRKMLDKKLNKFKLIKLFQKVLKFKKIQKNRQKQKNRSKALDIIGF